MKKTAHFTFSVLFLILMLCLSLANVGTAFADEGTPTDVPVVATTEETPAEPPVAATDVPVEATTETQTESSVPATEAPLEATPAPEEFVATSPAEDSGQGILAQLPENADVVVLDESGTAVSLASQEAATIVQDEDPLWCPAGALLDSPLCRHFTGTGSVQALIDNMREDPGTYSADSVIYFTSTVNGDFVLNDLPSSLGNSFATLSGFGLTLQGGWDGNLTLAPTINGQSSFGSNIISVGTLGNPWVGSVNLNNISTLNTASNSASVTVNSNGNVGMTDVSVAGSGAGQNGISIAAPNVTLNNVSSSFNDENGIEITTTGTDGTVTLNNVTASNNGHVSGSEPVGSGVLINGSNTTVNVIGGSFNNNARYGIEARNSNSTTLPAGNLWTDTQDYAPGSVVTISGNDNSLNGDHVGFLAGETVHVEVQGPNGYTASCEGVANEYGHWSCQITLWASDLAVGEYTYTASGLTSGVSVTGSFTDAREIDSVSLNGVTTQITVSPGAAIMVQITVKTTGTDNAWLSTGYRISTTPPGTITCVNHADHTGAGKSTETIVIYAPSTPGTYNVYFYAYNDNSCTSGQSTVLTLTDRVVVSKITPTLSVTNSPVTYNGSAQAATLASSAPGTITNVRYNGSGTVPTNAGTYAVTADFTPYNTIDFNSLTNASAGNFTINKATPVITFGAAPSPTYPGSNFTVNATTTNTDNNALIYSYGSGPCALVDGNSGTFSSSGTGTCVVQASGTATTNFNAASQTQSVTILSGNSAPALNLPGPITAEATSPAGAAVTFSVSATDPEDNPDPTPTCDHNSGDVFGLGVTSVNCSVTDLGGLTTNGSFSVTVQDTTAPAVTVPADLIREATGTGGAAVDFIVSASDAVDGSITPNCSAASGDTFALGTTTITCSATDAHGNTGSASFNITIEDTISPIITLVGRTPANGDGWNNSDVVVTWSCSDAGSGVVSGIVTQILSSEGADQTATGTCTDNVGNTASDTQTGINIDKTGPSIIAAATTLPNGNGWYNGDVTIHFTCTDALSGVAVCPDDQLLTASGTSTTQTATDHAGNTSAPSNTVTVQIDKTAPTISAAISTGTPGSNGWYRSDVTVHFTCADAGGSDIAAGGCPADQILSTEGASISSTAQTVTDQAGNTSTPSNVITVSIDKTIPTIAAAITSGTFGNNGWYTSDVTVHFTCADAGGSGIDAGGCPADQILSTEGNSVSSTVQTVTDRAGLESAASNVITVKIDKTAPTANASALPAPNGNGWNNTNVTVSFTGADALSGLDFCDADVVLSSEGAGRSASGTCTDQAGNVSASATVNNINIDKTVPSLTLPPDFPVEATSATGATATFITSVTDNLDPAVAVTCTHTSGEVFPLGSTAVDCSATDAAGNASTGTFTVTVRDTTAPVIAPHGDLFIDTFSSAGITVNYLTPTTTDAVDGAGIATCTPASGSNFPIGNTVVKCTAMDAHKNVATLEFTVHVTLNRISTGGTNNGRAHKLPDLVIPVTGGSNFNIACTEPKSFSVQTRGANIIFNHLCGYDAFVEGVEAASLPGDLPAGASLLSGFTVHILKDGKVVNPLPKDATILIQFELPASQNAAFTVLLWSGNQWVEVTGKLAGGFFELNTAEDGTFIFIQK